MLHSAVSFNGRRQAAGDGAVGLIAESPGEGVNWMFSTKTERLFTVCWYLRKSWLSAAQLASICQIPERTIYRDLKELHDLSIVLKCETLYHMNESWAPALESNNA